MQVGRDCYVRDGLATTGVNSGRLVSDVIKVQPILLDGTMILNFKLVTIFI